MWDFYHKRHKRGHGSLIRRMFATDVTENTDVRGFKSVVYFAALWLIDKKGRTGRTIKQKNPRFVGNGDSV